MMGSLTGGRRGYEVQGRDGSRDASLDPIDTRGDTHADDASGSIDAQG